MSQDAIIAGILKSIGNVQFSESDFEALALELFAYQFQNNLPLQRFCRQQGKTTRTVKSWRDIPAVPINAFKSSVLSCVDSEATCRVFMTSGTTQGHTKGKHFHPSLSVYDLSMQMNFRHRFMQGLEKIRMGILFPSETLLPNSSLAHYLSLAVKTFGLQESRSFIGANGLEVDELVLELEQTCQRQEPYALLGASYGYVHLIDELRSRGLKFKLPQGSRLLDTGGFKGQSRELSTDEFYDALNELLGIDRKLCINMYGMTELSTQFYDSGNDIIPPVKSGPHWIRSLVVDPLSGEPLEDGQAGLLVHCDLANFNSVTNILTEDIGVKVKGGFHLLGRAKGSAAKGCSLAVEEFLKASST